MSTVPTMRSRAIKSLRHHAAQTMVQLRISHLHGPRRIELEPDEAAVTCLVKDGDYYIAQFLDHHFRLGFKHVFLLDNGSTDKTLEIAKSYPAVSIYQTSLPIGRYQARMKAIFSQLTVRSGWCLDVDIDEFFLYPLSEVISLQDFLAYLNNRNYTVVLTQMIDMFSDRPLSALSKPAAEDIASSYPYYDLSNVEAIPYSTSDLVSRFASTNELPADDVRLYFGGIRKTLFDLRCLLTKHSLFKADAGLSPFTHVHFVDGGRIADVSAALLHFKLVGNCYMTSVANGKAFTSTRQGYEDLVELIDREPDRKIVEPQTRRLENSAQLLDDGILYAADAYIALADSAMNQEPNSPKASS